MPPRKGKGLRCRRRSTRRRRRSRRPNRNEGAALGTRASLRLRRAGWVEMRSTIRWSLREWKIAYAHGGTRGVDRREPVNANDFGRFHVIPIYPVVGLCDQADRHMIVVGAPLVLGSSHFIAIGRLPEDR